MTVDVKNGSYMERYDLNAGEVIHTDDVIQVVLATSGRYIFRLAEVNQEAVVDDNGDIVLDENGETALRNVETHQWLTDTALTTPMLAAEWIGNLSQAAASALRSST